MVSGNMKKYEKQLKSLHELSDYGSEPVHQRSAGLSEADARRLSALGLVELYGNSSSGFFLTLTDDGLAYFANKSTARIDFFKNHFANFLTGFLSGALAGVVGTLLVQRFTHGS